MIDKQPLPIHRAEPQYIRCPVCGKPMAEVRDGTLIIKTKHHGAWHVVSVSLDDLVKLAA